MATTRSSMPQMASGMQTMPSVAQAPPGSQAMNTRPWPQPTAEQPSVTVASYADYADAQRAVDHLSDQGFPVQNTSIVGTGLRLEEQVLGRLTTGRAALSGAGAGAWFGLLIGLLLGLFVGGWVAVVLAAVLIGAVWGAIFGAVAQATTRGQRDFSSRSQLRASEYAVNVSAPYADQARDLLTRLSWNRGTSGSQGNAMR